MKEWLKASQENLLTQKFFLKYSIPSHEKMAKKFIYFDSGKAVRELGLPQTPVRQALVEAMVWFR